MSDSEDAEGGPMQVSDPNYHNVNHTAAQTCGWTKNALEGEGKCYGFIISCEYDIAHLDAAYELN